jgi:hypothetical protein
LLICASSGDEGTCVFATRADATRGGFKALHDGFREALGRGDDYRVRNGLKAIEQTQKEHGCE